MDQKILNQLSELQKAVTIITETMATKDDLENFATKDDLKDFATKDDLKNFATKDDLKNFATKDDLEKFATKVDLETALANHPTNADLQQALANHPTKQDLHDALAEQSKDICQVMTDLFIETDNLKASKKDLIALDKRVTKLEQN